MLLGEILHEGVITTDLKATNKDAAIEELVDKLVEAHEIPLSARDTVLDAVLHRERSMSTGMDYGVALPHASSDKVDDIVGALGVSNEGVPFETLDGLPAKLVLLLVLPRRNFQGHVRTLAGIAHLLGNAVFRDALKKARTVKEILSLIEREEDKDSLANLPNP